MAALKEKYGDKAHLFNKDLHPQIKYFDACTLEDGISLTSFETVPILFLLMHEK